MKHNNGNRSTLSHLTSTLKLNLIMINTLNQWIACIKMILRVLLFCFVFKRKNSKMCANFFALWWHWCVCNSKVWYKLNLFCYKKRFVVVWVIHAPMHARLSQLHGTLNCIRVCLMKAFIWKYHTIASCWPWGHTELTISTIYKCSETPSWNVSTKYYQNSLPSNESHGTCRNSERMKYRHITTKNNDHSHPDRPA